MIKNLVMFFLGIFDKFHNKKIINFLKSENIKQFNVFFDIGAHNGETIILFNKYFKIKKLYSFEASPINFLKLKKRENYLKHKFYYTDIKLENIALGSKEGVVSFKQFKESSSSTIKKINEQSTYYKKKMKFLNIFNSKDKNYEEFNLKVETLKNYISEKKINSIDFIKIDTEGYEYEILKGLGDSIIDVKYILFEHHYDNMIQKNYTFTDINNLLKEYNFKSIFKKKMPFRKTFEYIYKNK